MALRLPFIPYPSINNHGVIGDRRTAALIAADGTVDWLCLPDYDGLSVFAALLDAQRGGYWRFGPAVPTTGCQTYQEHSAAVVTTWATETGHLELTDLMLWPDAARRTGDEGRRVLLRRLLGNYPLLFSQVRYVRAVLALRDAAHGQHAMRRVGHALHGAAPPADLSSRPVRQAKESQP